MSDHILLVIVYNDQIIVHWLSDKMLYMASQH